MIRQRAIDLTLCASLAAGLLGGCGYHPLYGSSAETAGVAAIMSSVAIPEADTRVGQIVRNDLISGMKPGNGGAPERYTLALVPTLKSTDVIARPQPATTRQSVNLVVSYELTDRQSGSIVSKGKTFSQVSFDVIRQPFADKQAQDDATARAAHEVSSDIRTRLAAYFSTQQ